MTDLCHSIPLKRVERCGDLLRSVGIGAYAEGMRFSHGVMRCVHNVVKRRPSFLSRQPLADPSTPPLGGSLVPLHALSCLWEGRRPWAVWGPAVFRPNPLPSRPRITTLCDFVTATSRLDTSTSRPVQLRSSSRRKRFCCGAEVRTKPAPIPSYRLGHPIGEASRTKGAQQRWLRTLRSKGRLIPGTFGGDSGGA